MCGILTYFCKDGISTSDLRSSLSAINEIRHRGPNGDGVVLVNTKTGQSKLLRSERLPEDITPGMEVYEYEDRSFDLLLGHVRLSIFDLSTDGFQPMADSNGNWIVFNGEVYNFPELKVELKEKGYSFSSHTDTEVILAAYKEWGPECLSKFNGMWSFVIWDGQKKSLFISNDRFGVKPLYYYESPEELIVCSEEKQFLKYPSRIQSINSKKIDTFLKWGYLDYDSTTYLESVYRFRPANFSLLNLENKVKVEESYNEYYFIPNTGVQKRSIEEATELFTDLLTDAVKLRMRADVPWGISVSGGVDSSVIAERAYSELGNTKGINSFSAIFPNKEGDESEFINIVNNHFNLKEHITNPLDEFNIDDFSNHVYKQDSPPPGTAFYSQWSVARLASETGIKVLLVGQGADEAFAGYHHHFYRYCRQLIFQGNYFMYLGLAKKFSRIKGIGLNHVHRTVLNEVKLQLGFKIGLRKFSHALEKKWNCANSLIELLKLDINVYTLPYYLRSDDRTGMAHGLESRHPFMDYRLINFGMTLSNNLKIKDGWQKWIIRNSMTNTPETIKFRKDKKGYTTPHEEWVTKYRNELDAYLPILKEFNIKIHKPNFRYYSLAIWLHSIKSKGL